MRVRVAAVIVKDNKILLVKHCKDNKTYWLLPGGGVEIGEKISSSLRRELIEELNIVVNSFELLFVVESISKGNRHLIQPTYLIKSFNLDTIKVGKDPRVCGFNFFSVNQLKEIIIYPDINDELTLLLNVGEKAFRKRYILKQWKN